MSTRDAMVGIYDDFPGYRRPSEAELDEALRTALVVVDTNLLLNLYRYTGATRDDLLNVLRGLGERLWVPHQVMREFWRNRLAVITDRGAGPQSTIAALDKQLRAASDAVNQWAKSAGVEQVDRDVLHGTLQAAFDSVEASVLQRTPALVDGRALHSDDAVLVALEDLLDKKVGAALEASVWDEAVAEGRKRVSKQQPPGYLDVDKENSMHAEGPAGDYIVWFETMEEAVVRGSDVVLVTGDEKEDWWWRHRTELLGPRVELVKELKDRGGHRLFMLRPTDLLKRASALAVEVSSTSVDDAERVSREATVSRESSAKPLWTRTGIFALIDWLDAEGVPHGEVIRAAAKGGGTVDRETVYEICGYDSGRMLRGFTRPTARVTEELVHRGIVEAGVEPALVPRYAGGVKAVEFIIPDEMVDILVQRVFDDDEDQPGDT